MKEKTKVDCVVTGIQNYGVFVTCGTYQGLIHISEISDKYVADITRLFNIGETLQACIMEKDEVNKKLTLSYKQAHIINPKVLNQIDIKIGFKTLENKLPNWIKVQKEKK